ncbi:MAG: Fe-S-containing hydro-lyase [Peptococcia bacterium]
MAGNTNKKITSPLTAEQILGLQAGDMVSLSGVIYTGRDAAHKRLTQALAAKEKLPIELAGQVLYYVGPCPARPGQVIGSCGPTTSSRVDIYTPSLLDLGLKGMIGKGPRSAPVIAKMKEQGAVYFSAIGGAGAHIAKTVKKAELVAYADLGPEAIYRLEVEDFPCIVAIDSQGNDLYQSGIAQFKI